VVTRRERLPDRKTRPGTGGGILTISNSCRNTELGGGVIEAKKVRRKVKRYLGGKNSDVFMSRETADPGGAEKRAQKTECAFLEGGD